MLLLGARWIARTLEPLLGPPGYLWKMGGTVVCTKDLLMHQEAREAARVRHVIDTHKAPLKTPPHESALSASNANITHIVS